MLKEFHKIGSGFAFTMLLEARLTWRPGCSSRPAWCPRRPPLWTSWRSPEAALRKDSLFYSGFLGERDRIACNGDHQGER